MKCRGRTRDKRYPYPDSSCFNTATETGFCRIHDPELKRKRQRDRDAIKDSTRIMHQAQPTGLREAVRELISEWHKSSLSDHKIGKAIANVEAALAEGRKDKP